VGIVEDASYREPGKAWALPGALNLKPSVETTWLLKTKAPITWTDVLALNLHGVQVLSREVVDNPPPTDQLPPEIRENFQPSQADVAIFVLVVVMALIEVVLLAGPAFAVGARRMQRQLAVVGANGGTPGQVRRAVLATGVVLGGLAALGGLAIGIALGWALLPVAQHWSNSVFGPFEVPWLHLVGVAAFGFVSAVIAAVVPAWIASRQDVVAVLSNRRGDRPSAWGPVGPALGVFLILVGLGLTGRGVRGGTQYGEIWIAFGAVFVVLGAVLLLRLFVALAARFAGRLPLALRYAVRDAHRHRTRTVPAIGAIMATVAGVVALGIANASDEAANRAGYEQQLPMGTGQVSLYSGDGSAEEALAASGQLATVVKAAFPDMVPIRALWTDRDGRWTDIGLRTGPDEMVPFEGGYASNQAILVADALPAVDFGISERERSAADRALEQGQMVAFASGPVSGSTVELQLSVVDPNTGEPKAPWSKEFPAHFANLGPGAHMSGGMGLAVLPPSLAKAVPFDVITNGFVIPDQVTKAQEKDLAERVEGVTEKAGVYVERGYQQPDEYQILLLVLGCLGALLMLGGTLTATFLALSDARPDLATLSAVGAGPRARRFVAASYALVLGLIGAVVGAAIGFVPGIAATYPLTSNTWTSDATSSHTVAIPWLLISSIVVALPLLTALVVGLFARSRLPIVARID
jgi:putative ABC transport system permease protein